MGNQLPLIRSKDGLTGGTLCPMPWNWTKSHVSKRQNSWGRTYYCFFVFWFVFCLFVGFAKRTCQATLLEFMYVVRDEWSMRRLTAGQSAKNEWLLRVQPWVGCLYHCSHSAQGAPWERRRKDCESRRVGNMLWNVISWRRHVQRTRELVAAVRIGARLAQFQTTPQPIMDRGRD